MFDQAQRHGYRNTSNIQSCKNICSTNTNIFRRYKFQLALKVPADVHVIFLNVLKRLFFHVRPVSCIPPHRLTPKSQHTITLITAQLITPLHHTNLSPHSLSPYFSHPTHTTSSHHHFITPTYPYHHTASHPTSHIQLKPLHHTTTSSRQLINITTHHATSPPDFF